MATPTLKRDTCEQCHAPIGQKAVGRPRRFCSARCNERNYAARGLRK